MADAIQAARQDDPPARGAVPPPDYRDLFDAAPTGYVVLDAAGAIVTINRAAAAMLGWDAAWLAGRSFDRWIVEADKPLFAAHRRRLLRGTGHASQDIRIKTRQGRIINLRLESARETAGAAAGGCRCVLLDVSGEQRSARRLRQLQSQLAHVARLNTVGELASGLAHELNQPLGTVVLNCEIALRLLASDRADEYEFAEALGQARDAASFASEVVRHLRGFLRNGSEARSACELRELIHDVAKLIRADARDNDMEVEFDIPPHLPSICVDPVQIEQVLLNLAHNGIEAMRDGTDRGRKKVTVAARRLASDRIEVSVADTGPGLDGAQLARIFTPFFTTKDNGMGMGLSISRNIIEAHGGRLWAESQPGNGATIRFELPALAAAPYPE